MALQASGTRARRSTAKTPQTRGPKASATMIDPDRRRALIAEAAYFRAERRGFEPGHEVEDWVAAEAEVDTSLTIGVTASKN